MVLWIMLLGISVGLRSMTAMAVLCWFAWSRLVPQVGWTSWTAYLVTAIVFTAAAVGEYVGDTLPQTPSRTSPIGVGARMVLSALVGAIAAHGIVEPIAGGVVFAVLGALVGTYGGYRVRMYGARAVGKDLPVALTESAVALMMAVGACWQLHSFAVALGLGATRLGIFQ